MDSLDSEINVENDGKEKKKDGGSSETELTKLKRQISTLQSTNRSLRLRLQTKSRKTCKTCFKLRKERDSLLRKFKNFQRENNETDGDVILLPDSERNPLDEALKEIIFLKKIITCLTTKDDLDSQNEANNIDEDDMITLNCTLKTNLQRHKTKKSNEDDGQKEDNTSQKSLDEELNKVDSVVLENLPTEENVKERVYFCCKCPRRYSHYRNLKVHEQECGKVFPCKTCGRVLSSTVHLRRHVKAVHEHVKPHRCQVCDKPFHSQGDLRRHIVSHSKLAAFKCTFCNETFSYKYNLARHIKKKHSNG